MMRYDVDPLQAMMQWNRLEKRRKTLGDQVEHGEHIYTSIEITLPISRTHIANSARSCYIGAIGGIGMDNIDS
jgi:hypothetical protein